MLTPSTLVTGAEIARLAGVTRATVSNWRRRHPDFPTPAGGGTTRPLFDLQQVRGWLADRRQPPPDSPTEQLREVLQAHPAAVGERLWPLLLAASRLDRARLAASVELPDRRLLSRAREAVAGHAAEEVPGAAGISFQPEESDLVRRLWGCVRRAGPARTAEVLAEVDRTGTHTSGSYRTPGPVAELMADLAADPAGAYPSSVFDPACGGGAVLSAAAARGARTLSGQDAALARAAEAATRLRLPGSAATVDIRVGDSLRADAFGDLAADAVLCNPPYGLRDWGRDQLAYDPRWAYGLPAKGEPELAWVQHCLAHVGAGRPAVLLMPPAASERPAGRRIRAELVRLGSLRAVVALPAGIAPPRHIGLQLWLLRRPRPTETTPASVLFVDATAPESGADDWDALQRNVRELWRGYAADEDGFEPVPGTARPVRIIDLLDELVDLTPARHVHTAPDGHRPEQQADTGEALRARLRRATAGLAALSGGAAWPPAGAEPRSWRTATVGDLLRGGALTLLRARDAGDGVEVEPGDILLAELLRRGVPAATAAGDGTAGQRLGRDRYLLRPDPQRFDPWFLAGFLSAEDNLHGASTGTSTVRIDPRRLRVPLLPLAEQRRYGRAFRRLHALRTAADLATRLADETTRTLAASLTAGALLPPGEPQEPENTGTPSKGTG